MTSHIVQYQIDFSIQDNLIYYLCVVIGNGQIGSAIFRNPAQN